MNVEKNNVVSLKRVEIVIDEGYFEDLQEMFQSVGIRGYTYMRGAGGFGSRGERNPGSYGLEEKNVVIILACSIEKLDELLEKLSPMLKETSGLCLISDCEWVKGPPESY